MQKTKKSSATGKSATSKPSSSAANAGASGKVASNSDKNSKDTFLKKLQICMKNFDYKDESRDVKGKTERLNAIQEL
jgi:hypothetical protein